MCKSKLMNESALWDKIGGAGKWANSWQTPVQNSFPLIIFRFQFTSIHDPALKFP